jgi:death on curing protein
VAEPIWIGREIALVYHDLQLAEHGGASGLRDLGLLESALGKPRNLFAYSDTAVTMPRLAASYAFGIAGNHPFVDGNKRTALVVAFAFLELNGYEVLASQEEAYFTFLAVASGETTEEQLTKWLEENSTVRRG